MSTPNQQAKHVASPKAGRSYFRTALFASAFLVSVSVAGTVSATPEAAPMLGAPQYVQADIEDPAQDAQEMQNRPRCEMNCRRAFLRCVNRVRGECAGDLMCLRERGSGCMDHYRACRQDNCGSTADDVPLPRLPF